MNGKEITDSTSTNHAYKVHLDTLLSYSEDVKKHKLKESMLYYDEEVNKAKATQIDDGGAYAKKQEAFTKNKGMTLRSQLYLDCLNSHRYLP